MIILILLIVILETWKRFNKKKELEKKIKDIDHTHNLLEIKSKIIELERKKLEIEKSKIIDDPQLIDPH